jgi:hypothetical protein
MVETFQVAIKVPQKSHPNSTDRKSGQITRISSRFFLRLEPTAAKQQEFLANLWPRLSLTAVSGFKALLGSMSRT